MMIRRPKIQVLFYDDCIPKQYYLHINMTSYLRMQSMIAYVSLCVIKGKMHTTSTNVHISVTVSLSHNRDRCILLALQAAAAAK